MDMEVTAGKEFLLCEACKSSWPGDVAAAISEWRNND